MARSLSISFHNYHPGMQGFVVNALSDRFDVDVVRFGKDVEFYSVFGQEFPGAVLKSDALKVWITGENRDPRHIVYDLHFGFHANPLLGDRSIRFPLWIFYIDWWRDDTPASLSQLLAPRRMDARPGFCNFIYSKDMSFRAEVFARLGARRHVDSLGGVLNNVGGRVRSKHEALATYRFTLAFENIRAYGYVTEKMLQPLAAGSIPIYWGAPEAAQDFNPEAFIDATQFRSVEALCDHVLALSQDEAALRRIAEAPIFADGMPYHHKPAFFADRIEAALDTPGRRVYGKKINAALAPRQTARIRFKALGRQLRRRA